MLDQVTVEAPPERLRLGSRLVPRSDLPPRDAGRMRELLDRHFAGVDAATFAADLASKNYVVLLEDAAGALRGFTTFHMGATRVGGRPITVVYSGDTIVDPVAWGSPVLPRAWIHAVYEVRSEFPAGDLYWLLLTSGFRTYRFLSVFWKRFYPRHDAPTPAAAQELLDALSRARYGAQYDAAAGIVRLETPQRLRDHLVEIPEGRSTDRDVSFFLARNPGYAAGDELVSLAALERDNLTAAGRRMVR
jgi:hypothetical protein